MIHCHHSRAEEDGGWECELLLRLITAHIKHFVLIWRVNEQMYFFLALYGRLSISLHSEKVH